MRYNQSCATKGDYGRRNRHLLIRSMQRAAVNVYKTDNSYEMLVFAPGRIKEHFHLDVKGNQLTVSYTPPEGFPRPEWVLREYSRGGFERTFTLVKLLTELASQQNTLTAFSGKHAFNPGQRNCTT